MSNFMNKYFGPLSKDYCLYFYILSIMFFIFFILLAITIFIFIIRNRKEVNFVLITNAIMALGNLFIIYLVNRLLHTMCVNSIH
jgi:4-amino-4-deoxy-L-arabinose transferase-like glycosyltransferase